MNLYFLSAAIVVFAIGLAHSVLGELLVFRRMRIDGLIPTNGGQLLREPHVRILWSSWHLVTVLGWCVAAVLIWLASPSNVHLSRSALSYTVAATLLGSSALVLIGTLARHPGWAGLLVAAVLVMVGIYV